MDELEAHIAAWPAEHVAVAVVGPEGVRLTLGDQERPFELASVTKLLSAVAVLVAVEEGSIALDEAAGPPEATVRHLLAHAAGVAPDGAVLSAPGTRRIYSNAGYDLLGQHLEASTGLDVATYLHEAVAAPVGMTSTRLVGSPAFAGVGTCADLAHLAVELLSPGRIVAPETLAEATRVQFPGLSGVLPGFGGQDPNDWGLGFELKGTKSPHWTSPTGSPTTFGHFGASGTFVWVDPEAGLACVCLTDHAFGPWAAQAWPPFSAAVLAGR